MPLYSKFPENLGGGDTAGEGPMDLLSDTIKAMLTTSTHVPSQTSHSVKADVTNEASGTGYTAGGNTIANKVYATTSLVTKFDGDDTTWTAMSAVHRNWHLYDDTPTSPADPLIGYIAQGADVNPGGNDLIYAYNAGGIFTLTVA